MSHLTRQLNLLPESLHVNAWQSGGVRELRFESRSVASSIPPLDNTFHKTLTTAAVLFIG